MCRIVFRFWLFQVILEKGSKIVVVAVLMLNLSLFLVYLIH